MNELFYFLSRFYIVNFIFSSALKTEKISDFKYIFEAKSDNFHVKYCDMCLFLDISFLIMFYFANLLYSGGNVSGHKFLSYTLAETNNYSLNLVLHSIYRACY